MSAYGVPPGYPQPAWAPPPKRRPKALWWIGGALLAVAVVVFLVLLGATIHSIHGVTSQLGAHEVLSDGAPHAVALPADEDALLFSDAMDPRCVVHDHNTGREVPLDTGGFADDSSDGWDLVGHFKTGGGVLDIACLNPGASWDVVAIPSLARTGVTLIAMVVVPGVLGLAGLVVLVIALILTLSRPQRPSYPAGYPPYPPPPPRT